MFPIGTQRTQQEEGFGGEEEHSVEEVEEDLSDEGHKFDSDRVSSWGSLLDVCLRRAFAFLPDRDRTRADLVWCHWHHVMRSPSLWRFRFFYFSGRFFHIQRI